MSPWNLLFGVMFKSLKTISGDLDLWTSQLEKYSISSMFIQTKTIIVYTNISMCNVYGDVQEMQLVIGSHLKKCF